MTSLAETFPQSIIAAFTQVFFAWRVKVLTGNYFFVCSIAFSAFAQFCTSTLVFYGLWADRADVSAVIS